MRERTDAGSDPNVVARVVLKAIAASDPAIRYAVGFDGALLQTTRSFLPASLFNRIVRRSLTLDES
jgi:hypothetical protein